MQQPSLSSFIQRMSQELHAKAVLFLRENGEILSRGGSVAEQELPNLAALITAMASAGRSIGEHVGSTVIPRRFGCEYGSGHLYVAAVGENCWLASYQEEVLNPGLFRRRVRKYADSLEKLVGTNPEPTATRGVTISPFENITDEELDILFTDAVVEGAR